VRFVAGKFGIHHQTGTAINMEIINPNLLTS